MKNVKKVFAAGLMFSVLMSMVLMTSCGEKADGGGSGRNDEISVVSREEGSGTRGAFVELFGIEEKDKDGNKTDHTVSSAEVTNSTSVMMQTIAGNKAAMGYISLGSLGDSVKALNIDGAEATLDNVKNGDYKVSRPFNIVTGKKLSAAAEDFIRFIMSDEGQRIVEKQGYVSRGSKGAFQPEKIKGTVSVSGSSSVTPLMEKLAEAYEKQNGGVKVEVQQSDSTTGITDAAGGISDIGMASRELTQAEVKKGIASQPIALDGIAIIVNHDNALNEISSEAILKIYTGEITKWSEIK